MSRYLRYLRIAFSALCGLAALLLVMLCVRSYWRWDALTLPAVNNCGISLKSFAGRIVVKRATISNAKLWPVGFETLKYDDHEVVLAEKYHVQNYTGPLFAKTATVVTVPQLSLVVAASAFAAAPWIGWSNRFSLRTLLIATTMIAVTMGLTVWATR